MGTEDKTLIEKTTPVFITKIKKIMKIFVVSLSVAILLLLIIGLGYSMQNPDTAGETLRRFFYSLVPNSRLYFTKVNNSRPACKIAQIKGDLASFKNLNVYPVYDEHSIYLYDSYSLNNLITTIPVFGHVNSVSCYVTSDLWMTRTGDVKLDKLKRITDGLYINCLYDKDGKNRFLCQFIPTYAFTMFYLSKTGDKETVEKLIKDSTSDNSISRLFNPSGKKQIIDGKIIHPGLVTEEIINIPFDNQEFLGLCFDQYGVTNIIAKDLSSKSLVILNDKGKTKTQYKIGRPFTAYVNYYLDYANVYVFDGTYFFHFRASGENFERDQKFPVDNGTFSNARFVPISNNDFSYVYYPLIVNNGKFIFIDESNNENRKKYQIIDLPKNSKFISYSNLETGGKHFLINFYYKHLKNIHYKTINQNITAYTPKFLNSENYMEPVLSGAFINLCLDVSNNNPVILCDVCDQIFIARTYNIDESVDEGYVTYVDNKLTIYFMNKNSIYLWQNYQEGIDNIKFQELNIEPEPIKTIQVNK